ncbi:unnamed protein product [Paramecium pentaurelia]|uniref:Uncharacterized protein n=1 Tax=Paramecium pentaurelia TaxID=43138 RepID=A0A8S1YLJ0_9CILI|nr:unnamed protein product [Paramecium pentaurelia]
MIQILKKEDYERIVFRNGLKLPEFLKQDLMKFFEPKISFETRRYNYNKQI